jgi:hypothetical protein
MAIIYSYPKNTDILSTDIILGTSTKIVNGRRKNITKNFEIGDVATFFNDTSAIAIAGQNNFFFQNNIAPGRKAGSISLVAGGGTNTPFNNITVLRISKFATSGNVIIDYISTLVNEAIIIAQCDDLNNFGIYKFNTITPVPGNPDFYDISITAVAAHGNILDDKFYGVAVYPGFVNPHIDPNVGDKTFVYTQSVASDIWEIEHNLNKFPSVSVVNINNVTMYGEVIYIDENNLQIEFSAGFSGKAYMN